MEREVHHQTEPPARKSNTGVFAVLIVVLLVVVAAILYFGGFLGAAGDGGTDLDADVQVEAPQSP